MPSPEAVVPTLVHNRTTNELTTRCLVDAGDPKCGFPDNREGLSKNASPTENETLHQFGAYSPLPSGHGVRRDGATGVTGESPFETAWRSFEFLHKTLSG